MSGNRVDACDPRGESAGEILESDNQFIKKFEWMWSMVGRAEPVPELHPSRKWNWHDIRSSAPEIEQRRWRVTIFDQAKLRYRAPHARVRALLDGGLTQQQIAKRLKVTLRTISSRVSELPPEPPKERTAAGLLTLRVEAGGGWHRQSFWPGSSDNIPRGSGWTRPSDGEGVYQQCVPALAVLERQRMTARRAA
jgi:hypothetical protein